MHFRVHPPHPDAHAAQCSGWLAVGPSESLLQPPPSKRSREQGRQMPTTHGHGDKRGRIGIGGANSWRQMGGSPEGEPAISGRQQGHASWVLRAVDHEGVGGSELSRHRRLRRMAHLVEVPRTQRSVSLRRLLGLKGRLLWPRQGTVACLVIRLPLLMLNAWSSAYLVASWCYCPNWIRAVPANKLRYAPDPGGAYRAPPPFSPSDTFDSSFE